MRRGFLLLFLATGAGVASLLPGSPPGPPAAHAQVKAEKCRDCHAEIYAEWQKSQHSKAWTDPRFQEAMKKAEDPDSCKPCHAPNPILEAGVGGYPTLRSKLRTEGVTCETCHKKENVYAGPFTAKETDSSGHYCAEVKEFRTYELCATCHGQEAEKVHNQVRTYKEGEFFKKGTSCQSCHMPETKRPIANDPLGKVKYPVRTGRKHTFAGSHDGAMLRRAARVEVAVSGRKATITVQNHDCGHSIPAAGDRVLKLVFEVVPGEGKIGLSGTESWGFDQRIAPKGTRSVEVDLVPAKGTIRATLWQLWDKDDPEIEWQRMAVGEKEY
ncbi:MAG: cytochrome c family protein [Planctomycetales bacterium]|nr:cytochrome c family protein [Planctomycetales bacterium]